MNFVYDGQTITVYVDGKPHSLHNTDVKFKLVVAAVKSGDEEQVRKVLENGAFNVKVVRNTEAKNVLELVDGEVYLDGHRLDNDITKRIQLYLAEDLPVEPLFQFLENILQNPSFRSREEGFKFLNHNHLPITDDGCFLGYKSVRSSYMDWHSNQFFNGVGSVVEMPRGNVDDDARHACSYGFHVGTIEYAQSFHNGYDRHIMIVKVNPRDMVSVPYEDANKLRVCRYEVVDEYKEHLAAPLYTYNNRSCDQPTVYEAEEAYEEVEDTYVPVKRVCVRVKSALKEAAKKLNKSNGNSTEALRARALNQKRCGGRFA